mmetsp:Transcript_95528/g.212477  ORF Transcript_95528/g.212477 Transcript_95528/m.212477 type:complete len:113 (+) Transcript_95528:937-1275(+)
MRVDSISLGPPDFFKAEVALDGGPAGLRRRVFLVIGLFRGLASLLLYKANGAKHTTVTARSHKAGPAHGEGSGQEHYDAHDRGGLTEDAAPKRCQPRRLPRSRRLFVVSLKL